MPWRRQRQTAGRVGSSATSPLHMIAPTTFPLHQLSRDRATAAGRAFFTKLLDGLGVETDSVFVQLDEPIRQALTVGRPIGFGDVERLPEATAAS